MMMFKKSPHLKMEPKNSIIKALKEGRMEGCIVGGFKIPNTEISKSTLHFLVGLGSLIANIQKNSTQAFGKP